MGCSSEEGKGRVYIILEKHNTNPHRLSELIEVKEGISINNLKHFILSEYGMRVELIDDISENKTTEGIAVLNIKAAAPKEKMNTKYLKYKNTFESMIEI